MLKMFKSKKAQNTAEYAILIALVVGAIIAMQSYAQRGLQARMRGTSLYMKEEMRNALATATAGGAYTNDENAFGKTAQYEPYYQDSNYAVQKDSVDTSEASQVLVGKLSNSNRIKAVSDSTIDVGAATTGYDRTKYNSDIGAMNQD